MQKINTVYVIHHSHTDIGYTDLQERVIDTQTHMPRSPGTTINETSLYKIIGFHCLPPYYFLY